MTRQNTRRDERDLERRIAELDRRVKSLETSPRTGNASVTHGTFAVKSNDVHLLRTGYLGTDDDGNDIRGTAMHRPTGEYMFSTWTNDAAAGGFWAWYDKQNNNVLSDDVVSGQGLATPYIGAPSWAPGDRSKWPSVTASSFTTQWYGTWWKQHPRLYVPVWAWTDAGTTGDVQVTCNGVSASAAVADGDNAVKPIYLTVPGAHLSTLQVTVDMRRTAGTGFCGCWPMGAYGVQS